MEPATRLFDWPFAPISIYYERFARQYRYVHPAELPQISHYIEIVHNLSGHNMYTPARTIQTIKLHPIWFLGNHTHSAMLFYNSWTRAHIKLLDPCFKTGLIQLRTNINTNYIVARCYIVRDIACAPRKKWSEYNSHIDDGYEIITDTHVNFSRDTQTVRNKP